jgi:quercetin dioxygenase-like cupin family protein
MPRIDRRGAIAIIARTHLRTMPLVAALTLFALAARSGLAQEGSPGPSPIEVTMLGKGLPTNAPGNYLELDRVTIAPGGQIPPHIHPGAYVLYVDSGDFGFTLIEGEAQLLLAGATGSAGSGQGGGRLSAAVTTPAADPHPQPLSQCAGRGERVAR